jgi:membrane associated rhomboid family serine protease
VPISDRDYMKPSPPPRREYRSLRNFGFTQNALWVIIGINLVIFIAARINDNVVIQLGLVPSLIGERPWTILTAMFVHYDIWHIFGNMLTLYYFGRVLSQLVGQNKFLLLYFGGGILGNALYILLAPPQSIAIGASGAIYAIAGALVVMMPTMRVAIWGILPLPLWMVILLFFVLWSLPNVVPGIAWQAHIGGLVAGLIAGFFFRRRTRYVY